MVFETDKVTKIERNVQTQATQYNTSPAVDSAKQTK